MARTCRGTMGGLTLSFGDDERRKVGSCGPLLNEVVRIRTFSSTPDTETLDGQEYAIYDLTCSHEEHPFIPKGESGYAYTWIEETKVVGESEYRRYLEDIYSNVDPKWRDANIKRCLQKTLYKMPVMTFLRWLTREEFELQARSALKVYNPYSNSLAVETKWGNMRGEAQAAVCRDCDLRKSLDLDPDLPESLYPCSQTFWHSYVDAFVDFLAEHGQFQIITAEYLSESNCDGIEVTQLPLLRHEINEANRLLRKKSIGAVALYDTHGELLHTTPTLLWSDIGEGSRGYLLWLDKQHEAIGVMHENPHLEKFQTRSLLTHTLESFGCNPDEYYEANAHYFVEIAKQGETFYGKTKGGNTIELPRKEIDCISATPLGAFDDSESIVRVSYAEQQAVLVYGKILDQLARFECVASKRGIRISISH